MKKNIFSFGYCIERHAIINCNFLSIVWKKLGPQDIQQSNFNRESIRVFLVIRGQWIVVVKHKLFILKKGNYLIVFPDTVIEDIFISQKTEIMKINLPFVADDTFYIP